MEPAPEADPDQAALEMDTLGIAAERVKQVFGGVAQSKSEAVLETDAVDLAAKQILDGMAENKKRRIEMKKPAAAPATICKRPAAAAAPVVKATLCL